MDQGPARITDGPTLKAQTSKAWRARRQPEVCFKSAMDLQAVFFEATTQTKLALVRAATAAAAEGQHHLPKSRTERCST